MLHKVSAFITRAPGELLVFHHDRSGIQVPAGTVEPGEHPDAAVIREVREESGITGLAFRHLESFEEGHEGVAYLRRPLPLLDRPRGRDSSEPIGAMGLRVLATDADWTQVRAVIEEDLEQDPPVVLRQVEGWVPSDELSPTRTRHLYHAAAPSETPDRWNIWVNDGGGFEFRFSWAPIDAPGLNPWQDAWLRRICQHLPVR